MSEIADRLAAVRGTIPPGVTLVALADALRRHLSPDDLFAGYADRLAELDGERLRGYLTGSIDAVLRVPGEEGEAAGQTAHVAGSLRSRGGRAGA